MSVETITLVATMRNEGPYVLEWVAYHWLIGFTDILVCSNDCDDGTPDLLDALAADGVVRHLPCRPTPDDKAQLFAYRQAEAMLAGGWPDWVMVLDADEFLNIHVGAGRVPDLLAATGDATAIMVNWRIFGSDGHDDWSAEPVLRRYVRAAARDHGVNLSFKTLFRQADAYHCPLLPHGPGHALGERVGGIRPVDGGGRPLPDRFARAEGFLQSDPGAVNWTLAQVNHYNTRAWQDYLVKHHRGGGLGPERWDRDSNWSAFNRNEEEDRSIQRHLPAVEAAIGDMLARPAIAAAHRRCVDGYRRHVERVAAA